MKSLTRSIVVPLTVFMFVFAIEAGTSSLSMEAHETGTGDGTYTNWSTSWGSYDRDFHRQKHLLIAVRDFSRKQKTPVTVHVYFIAHPQGRQTPLFVYATPRNRLI